MKPAPGRTLSRYEDNLTPALLINHPGLDLDLVESSHESSSHETLVSEGYNMHLKKGHSKERFKMLKKINHQKREKLLSDLEQWHELKKVKERVGVSIDVIQA